MPSATKMFCFLIILTCLIGLTSPVLAAQQDPRYISDTLVINLKNQMEPPFKVVARLKSDDKVIILQEKGKFIQVKTDSNITGWLAKRYTTTELPKKLIIKELQQKIQSLENTSTSLHENTEESQEREELITQQRTIITQLEAKIAEQENSTTPAQVENNQYRELQKQYTALEEAYSALANGDSAEELIRLQADNERLQNKQYIYFLLTGAFILAVGLFLGKSPDSRRSKRLFF